jgi:hypothetical protein
MPDDNSLIEGIYPPDFRYTFPEEAQPEGPPWRPWHKPRKQWMRYHQWNKEIESLLARLNLDDRAFRYLSLPGDDLLDFRVVAELCKTKGIRTVRLVGFNALTDSRKSPQRLAFAQHEVYSLDIVAENSDVHPDDFNAISDTESVAYKFAKEKGPYDVINLDLCDSFSGTDQKTSYYRAALNLFNLQAKNRAEPWVFLLTTRGDRRKVNTADFQMFWSLITANSRKSPTFRDGLETFYTDVPADTVVDPVTHAERLPPPRFEKLFGLCIGKWLLSLIANSGRWTVRLCDSYWYRTQSSPHPNMLSLSFLFEPFQVDLTDSTGLAGTDRPAPQPYNEAAQAIGLLEMTNRLVDLDIYLRDDRDAFEESIAKSEVLLGKAGYPITGYRDWALSVLPVLSPM